MKVIIAGAGIGGLTLALMLHRRNIDVEIYEQASEVKEIGVGINTLPAAIRKLAEIVFQIADGDAFDIFFVHQERRT